MNRTGSKDFFHKNALYGAKVPNAARSGRSASRILGKDHGTGKVSTARGQDFTQMAARNDAATRIDLVVYVVSGDQGILRNMRGIFFGETL